MDFADRFILQPSPTHHEDPSYIAQLFDDTTDWVRSEEACPGSLYELLNEQTKLRSFNFEGRNQRGPSPLARTGVRYHNAKDFEGFPWVELPSPTSTHLVLPVQIGTAERRLSEQNSFLTLLSNCLYLTNGETAMGLRGEEIRDYRLNYSMGNLYPVDVYVTSLRCPELLRGCYYYHPPFHWLYKVSQESVEESLIKSGIPRALLKSSLALVTFVGAFERSTWRFGERGYRYTLIETGMAVERLCLAADQYGLSVQRIAAFVDDCLNEMLHINGVDESVLFTVSLQG